MEKVYVKTGNGKTEIVPIYCEVTGDQIGWKTVLPEDASIFSTPAYLSFDVVDEYGKQRIDSDIDTF